MSFSLVLCWSVVRSVSISTVAIWCFLPLQQHLRKNGPASSRDKWLTLIAVAPLLMPDLLSGFTYRLVSASLDFSEATTELIYAVLLLAKVLAIQFVCRWLVPPSTVSESALHLWKLSGQQSWQSSLTLLRMKLIGPYRSMTVGWILGVLWCFQEFETAAILQIEQHPIAWTVWLFDAKAANEPLTSCLLYACPAIAIQGILIALCLVALRGSTPKPDAPKPDTLTMTRDSEPRLSTRSWTSISVVTVGFVVSVAWPVLLHSIAGIRGLWELSTTATLRVGLEQIAKSTVVAGCAALGSWYLSRWMLATHRVRLTLALILPGLLSPLVLSLLLLSLFLSPVFRSVYDSWFPLLLAQSLWLLPRACLLCVAVDRQFCSAQIHTAQLLRSSNLANVRRYGRGLCWIMEQRPAWFSVAVLMVMAFWEVTINSILHPVSLQPTVCRLYREMHFGHTEVLAGLTALSVIFPLLALAILAQIRRLIFK